MTYTTYGEFPLSCQVFLLYVLHTTAMCTETVEITDNLSKPLNQRVAILCRCI